METVYLLKMKQEYNSSLRKIFNTPITYKEPNELTSMTVKCATYTVGELLKVLTYIFFLFLAEGALRLHSDLLCTSLYSAIKGE